jgi:hypothetical protein
MATPQLTKEQRESLFAPLLEKTKAELERLSQGDQKVLWALRRKHSKELMYLERSTPMARKKLKMKKWIDQKGICPICSKQLPETYSVLDRLEAFGGYTVENTRLLHHECHVEQQVQKNYT